MGKLSSLSYIGLGKSLNISFSRQRIMQLIFDLVLSYPECASGNANVTGTTPTELGKLAALEYMVLGKQYVP